MTAFPTLDPTAWPLRRRCETIARLWATQYAALQLTLLREQGEEPLADFKYRILHMHHKAHFLDGVRKLGLSRDLPPAVVAARYHFLYLSREEPCTRASSSSGSTTSPSSP
jgi:hypothetical protein